MFCLLRLFWFACCLETVVMITEVEREELLSKDPSLWPGHMERFGSKQRTAPVKVLDDWPDPIAFFTEYADKNVPVVFKGMAKRSPAYKLFTDDYFKNAPGADTAIIYAEPELKENRTKAGYDISVKEFIERYHKETLYMVNALPPYYCTAVRIPPPIRCEETRKLLSSQVTWFSSGGTKSVLHNDDVDNINCLFRGTKELWFIHPKNRKYLPMDRLEGGYSSLDVEKVNYTKFPDLRKVDLYHKVDMEEGDCLFIPVLWYHQVNSKANADEMNLAVNVWFKHVKGHRPKKCDLSESNATIDKYYFVDDDKEAQEKRESYLDAFFDFIKGQDSLSLDMFLDKLKNCGMVNEFKVKVDGIPEEFRSSGKNLFTLLDYDKNGKFTEDDINKIEKLTDAELQKYEMKLNNRVAFVEDFLKDLKRTREDESEESIDASAEPTDDSDSITENYDPSKDDSYLSDASNADNNNKDEL